MNKTVKWVGAALLLVLLWQVKGLHPFVAGLVALIILGIVLRNYTEIRSQITSLN